MKSTRIKAWTVAAAAILAGVGLSACGGDGDGSVAVGDGRVVVRSITVFGDSLSDVGTYGVTTGNPLNPGKFTINPGKVWVENVAAYFGLSLSPNRSLTMDKDASSGATTAVGTATVIGGNGYAEGGARVSQLPSESGVGNNQLVAPVSQQVSRYLASNGSFPLNQLVIIDGGSNDTYAQFDAICFGGDDNQIGAGNTTLAIATAAISKAANDLLAQVKLIKANGAAVVAVAGAFDWSVNPFGLKYLTSSYQSTGCIAPVPAAQITAWTSQFNKILSDGVDGLPGVVYVDAAKAFVDVVANPGHYGFTNVTDSACTNTTPTNSAVYCTENTIVSPNGGQTYFWSDSFHPTPHGHQVLSDLTLTLLQPVAKPLP